MKIPNVVCLILFFSCSIADQNEYYLIKFDVESMLEKWNDSTLNSVKSKKYLSKDDFDKDSYENELESLKYYLSVEDMERGDNHSLRYKFLKKVIEDSIVVNDDYFIVERIKLGEQVELKNCIFYVEKDKYKVYTYTYNRNKWVRENDQKKIYTKASKEIAFWKQKEEIGDNFDDIIITHLRNDTIFFSHLFTYKTLSAKSIFMIVLED